MCSKQNVRLIVDSVIELTGNPFKANQIMTNLSKSEQDFNRVRFVKKKKIVREIMLEGNPEGLLKVKL